MKIVKRVFALLAVVVMIGLIVAALVMAITGNDNYWGMFYLAWIVPVILWVFSFVAKVLSDRKPEIRPTEDEEKKQEEENTD